MQKEMTMATTAIAASMTRAPSPTSSIAADKELLQTSQTSTGYCHSSAPLFPTTTTGCDRGLDSTRVILLDPRHHHHNNNNNNNNNSIPRPKRCRSLPSFRLLELVLQEIDDLTNEDTKLNEKESQAESHNNNTEEDKELNEKDDDDTAANKQQQQHKQDKELNQQEICHSYSLSTSSSSSAVAAAKDRVLEFFQHGSCFSLFLSNNITTTNTNTSSPPLLCCLQFNRNEIRTGKMLGRGSFAEVRELSHIKKVSSSNQTEPQDVDTKESIKKSLSLQEEEEPKSLLSCPVSSNPSRYAIKQVRRDLVQQAQHHHDDNTAEKDKASSLLWAGIIDLAVETIFLQHLHHSNIIQLCGVSRLDMFSTDYFVILDRLHDTLYTRIHEQWKLRLERHQLNRMALTKSSTTTASSSSHGGGGRGRRGCSSWTSSFHTTTNDNVARQRKSYTRFLRQRLVIARDISSAIAYLHDKRVCHRDLKPCNVGFDMNGTVKVFDFGLARELPPRISNVDVKDVYQLTQLTGTLRFMAPEVAIGLPYNEQCDVYSFALMVWEMTTCTRPYAKLQTEKDFVQQVFEQGQRPKIPTTTTFADSIVIKEACQDLLQGGWDANLSNRWTIHQMQAALELMCTRLDDELSSSSSSSSSSSLHQQQRAHQQQQHQEVTGISSSKKQSLGSKIIPIRPRRTTASNINNKASLFTCPSWPKTLLRLPYYKRPIHHHHDHHKAPQSGHSSTTREEEEEHEDSSLENNKEVDF